MKVQQLYTPTNFKTAYVQDDIFYISQNSVYNFNNNKKIYTFESSILCIKEYGGSLWICLSDNSLVNISTDGKLFGEYNCTENTIHDFYVCDKNLFCLTDKEIEHYVLSGFDTVKRNQTDYKYLCSIESINGIECFAWVYRYDDIKCINIIDEYSNNIGSFVLSTNDNTLLLSKDSLYRIIKSSNEEIVYYYLNDENITFIQQDIQSDKSVKRVEETVYNVFDNSVMFEKGNQYTFVSQITTNGRTINREPEVAESDKMVNHKNDFLNVFNAADFSINCIFKTKTFERILYADSQKAITYYKGQYLTYSLSDWEVIKEQNADEIKNGGSYTFESCGEYIFVFDDKQGKLINTIGI